MGKNNLGSRLPDFEPVWIYVKNKSQLGNWYKTGSEEKKKRETLFFIFDENTSKINEQTDTE